jgi:hypothetical protein
MGVLTIEGIVDQGQIRLKDSIDLPDNTLVYVVVPGVPAKRALRIATPHLVHRYETTEFTMEVARATGNAEL